MYLSGIIGCSVLLCSPLAAAFIAAFYTHPQLLLVFIASAMVAFVPLLLTSLVFVALRILSIQPIVYLLIHVALCELLRLLSFAALVHIDAKLRRENNGMTLLHSRLRLLPVWAAVGFGFGAIAALRGPGTLLDATRRLTFPTAGTTVYDMSICPRLPLLVHTCLQSALLLAAHVSWGVMSGQAVAALRELWDWPKDAPLAQVAATEPTIEADVEPREPCNSRGKDSEGDKREEKEEEEERKGGREEEEEEEVLLIGRSREGDAKRPSAAQKEDSLCEAMRTATGDRKSLQTYLHETPQAAWATLLAAPLIHVCFSLVSLLNMGAFDYTTFEEIPNRGCVVTLPFQMTITIVSILWALVLIINDWIPRLD